MYRNYKLNELRIENAGEEVVLSGWISKIRDKGHFVFIDLRDRYGVTQIFVNEEVSGKEMLEKTKKYKISYFNKNEIEEKAKKSNCEILKKSIKSIFSK